MREILFRGKRTDNGEWVEGNLFVPDKDDTPTQICIGTNIIRITYDIVPETVGQYTGLTDKNGKKIFEGDIVDCWSEGVNAQGTVQQRRDGLWIIYPAWQNHIMWGLCPDEYSNTTVEVIGNIHDNSDIDNIDYVVDMMDVLTKLRQTRSEIQHKIIRSVMKENE